MEFEERRLRRWSEFRAQIVHEDNLVNHRFTWLLSIEAFIMAGFFLIQTSVFKPETPHWMIVGSESFLSVVMFCAAWICYITGKTITAAYLHVAALGEFWERLYDKERWDKQKRLNFWPEVSGKNTKKNLDVTEGLNPVFPPLFMAITIWALAAPPSGFPSSFPQ